MPDPSPEMVQLTQEQFATLQRGQLLLQKLATGATKRKFENIVKEIVPEVETTDDQIAEYAQPYVDKLEAANQRLEDFLKKQEEERNASSEAEANARLSGDFAKMRAEGLTETGEAEVRKIMIERNVADPWAAFALWERNNPKPPEGRASWEPDSWNIAGNAVARDNDGLFKDADLWADVETHNVLAELRRPAQI